MDSDSVEEEPAPIPDPNGPLPTKLCAPNLQTGYTDKISYLLTEKVTLYLQSNEAIDLCKLIVYDMNDNEAFSIASPLTQQTVSTNEPSMNGFGFNPTVTFDLPANLKSGVYMIERKIPFIVKTSEPVDLMIVYAANTANAYCTSGGKGLYTVDNKPYQVSFHRPIPLEAFSKYCLKWFEELDGFTVGYITDSDLDDYSTIEKSKILVLVGHNEYWTRTARQNFDKFVNEGKDALILSGNTMWWQVRYNQDKSIMIRYYLVPPDPETNPLLKTTTWDTPSLQYPIYSSIGADFPRGGYGLKTDAGWNGFKIATPNSPLLEGLNLSKGDILRCPTVEFDGAPIASFDGEGYPVIDNTILNFDKVELIGFDKGFRVTETYGTFIVFKKNAQSGVVINTSSTDWCSEKGMGGLDADKIKTITLNAITKLKNKTTVFSN
jgi:hypothetical protein